MPEVLSQEEVDSLLSAISAGEANIEDYANVGEQRKVRVVDFRYQAFLSKRQICNLQIMHEEFTRLVAALITMQTNTVVHMHVGSVDQLTYEEFIRSIPNPTNCSIINMYPLEGSAILQLDHSISYTILDLLYGGDGNFEPLKHICKRSMTEVEMSTMEGQIVRILGALREVWAPIIDIRPRFANIESNPHILLTTGAKSMCVLITIEFKIGDTEGYMNIMYPGHVLKPILQKLKVGPEIEPAKEIPLDFPMQVRCGFTDVFVPFCDMPGVGDTVVIGKYPEFQLRYEDQVIHVFKDNEIDAGKDKSDG